MKIYGHFASAPSNKVRLTASALGLDHDYIHVDLMTQENKQDAYLAINPYGRVPAMDDDGFKLAESSAIMRYLASKTDGAMYPAGDAKARAIVDQWLDYASHHVLSNMAKMFFNKVVAPMRGAPVDEKSIEEGRGFLDASLPFVEEALGNTSHVAGDTLTLADMAMLAGMEPFDMIEYDYSGFPNIKAWRERLMATDWYKSVHTHFGAEMAV